MKNTISEYLGPKYQFKLIWQLLVENKFAEKYINSLSVEYFDDNNYKKLFRVILEYFTEYEKPPSILNNSIEQAIYKYSSKYSEKDVEILLAIIEDIKKWNNAILDNKIDYDGDVVRELIIDFLKQQEYRKLGEFILSKVENGEIKNKKFNFTVEEKIDTIRDIGHDDNEGVDVFDNMNDALAKDFREPIPTGILFIDELTGGGLGKSEVGLILAPTGVGKTTTLTVIANTAYEEGKNVLYIVFEDSVKQLQRKHYAIWSKVPLSEIDDRREEVAAKVIEKRKKLKERGGRLIIVKFNEDDVTIKDIKYFIDKYQMKYGIKFDMVVLDYLDCLEPHKKAIDQNQAELIIIKGFESMIAQYNIPGWTAIQSNRGGFNALFVEAQHTGGSIKRVQKSHFVMSIAKPNELDDTYLANIKILKARFAKAGQTFEEVIFNNDTLEIRSVDSGYKKKKKNDNEPEKAIELTEKSSMLEIHNKINEISEKNAGNIEDAQMLDNHPKIFNNYDESDDPKGVF